MATKKKAPRGTDRRKKTALGGRKGAEPRSTRGASPAFGKDIKRASSRGASTALGKDTNRASSRGASTALGKDTNRASSRGASTALGKDTNRASTRRTDSPQGNPARRDGAGRNTPRRILVLDVGGSHVKLRLGDHGAPKKFVSGPKMAPGAMVKQVLKLFAPTDYDAVSIGYPGVVFRGRIAAEPFNLGAGWVGFDFEAALGKPVRVINDAAMQAVGSYTGGRMLFLGLGTGMGATLVLDGVVEPMEFGHLPYKNGRTYEQYVGQKGLDRLGKKRWRKEVAAVVERLRYALEVEYVVLGGGNVRLLKELPKKTRHGANSNALKGGQLIWEANGSPLILGSKYRQPAGVSRA